MIPDSVSPNACNQLGPFFNRGDSYSSHSPKMTLSRTWNNSQPFYRGFTSQSSITFTQAMNLLLNSFYKVSNQCGAILQKSNFFNDLEYRYLDGYKV